MIVKRKYESSLPGPEYTIHELLELGVVVVDKHRGPTSSQVTAYVRDLFNAKKAGHGGTLDPGVSGVLPVLLNRASRLAKYLLEAGKEYVAYVKFHSEVDERRLLKTLKLFTGPIYQKPPVRSAVSRRLRIKRVYDFKLIEFYGREALIWRSVESGTYIRKLVRDIGLYMGVNAHMAELRRVRAGPFREEEALNVLELRCLKEKYEETGDEKYIRIAVRPPEEAVRHLPKIYVTDAAAVRVSHGSPLFAPGVVAFTEDLKKNSYAAMLTAKGRLIGIVLSLVDAEELKSMEKGEVAKPRTILRVIEE